MWVAGIKTVSATIWSPTEQQIPQEVRIMLGADGELAH